MVARAIGTGTISFGLVSIPIKLYSTNRPSSGISFNMINGKTGSRVRQKLVDATTGDEVSRADIVKGYEFSKGQYVTFTEEELQAIEEEATRAMEITEFVRIEEVDPIFFEQAYYLGPDKGGDKAYHLLGAALRQTGLAGVARYAARGRQYLVLVRPMGEGLVMQQLRFSEEVKTMDEVPLGGADIKEKELALAVQLIQQNAAEAFEADKYTDEWKGRLQEIIDKKVAGAEVIAPAAEAPQAQIIDIMEALKASLAKSTARSGEPAERKAPKKSARAAASAEPAAQKPAATTGAAKKKRKTG